jgi:hypothetical protein
MNTNLKILSIGNSFSEDALSYLWDIANHNNIHLTLGNLYIGGCDLETHANNALNKQKDYIYYKNTSGSFVPSQASIDDGLFDETWDIITLQQASHKSGIESSYEPYLTHLITYVKKHQPQAKLYWHMTWAYQEDSDHPNFIDYNKDQIFMYKSIKHALINQVLKHKEIENIIYTGKVIQAFRNTHLGDSLTRDGFHLSLDIGRYIASLSWFLTFYPNLINQIHHLPWVDNKLKELINQTMKNLDISKI